MSASTKKAKGVPSTLKKKPVSEEFVRSSDDESDTNKKTTEKRTTPRKSAETKIARTTKPKETPVPLPKSPVRTSNLRASQPQKEKLSKQNAKSTPPAPAKSNFPKKPQPKPVEVPQSSEEESDSSEEDQEKTSQINDANNATSGDTTPSLEDGDSESIVEEGSGSDETDTSGMSVDQAAIDKPTASSKSKEREIDSSNSESEPKAEVQSELEAIAAQEFVAPPGFLGVDINKTKTAESVRLLTGSRVAEKQIWHIIAPASLPAEEISKISLEKVSKGVPVISHGGVEYSLSKEDVKTTDTSILLPEESGYLPIRSNVQGTVQLQQVISLPTINKKATAPSNGLDSAAPNHVNPPKSVRQQPKGLRMRFRMSGRAQNDGMSLERSDSEQDNDETAPTKTNAPPASFKKLSKSKHTERDVEQKETSKLRKEKEGKKRKKEDEEGGKRKKKREA